MKHIVTGMIFAGAALAHAAAAGTAAWGPVNSPSFESSSNALAVAFDTTGNVGFSGAGDPACPAFIRKTSDAGKTWKRIWPTGNCSASDYNIFLSAVARGPGPGSLPLGAVVGGTVYQTYTMDGKTFGQALHDFHTPALDAHVIPGSYNYAFVHPLPKGPYGGNYVRTSGNGKVWDVDTGWIPDSVLDSQEFHVRYGAFPAEKTWYVTAGNFGSPLSPPMSDSYKLSQFLTIDRQKGSGPGLMHIHDSGTSGSKCAAIIKTTNQGKSWEVVYMNHKTGDNIYPNGIHCSNSNHCVAVLEGDSARIIVTRDGGKTWNETMRDNDPHSSLIAVRMVTDTEVWVAGGDLTGNYEGRFYHSIDGGNTWKKEAFPYTYFVSLEMPKAQLGYAVALTKPPAASQPSGVKLFKFSA